MLQEQLTAHLQIWLTVAAANIASLGLENLNSVASTFALICGGLASLSIAWWHIFKRK